MGRAAAAVIDRHPALIGACAAQLRTVVYLNAMCQNRAFVLAFALLLATRPLARFFATTKFVGEILRNHGECNERNIAD